jgi:hypothetical protein
MLPLLSTGVEVLISVVLGDEVKTQRMIWHGTEREDSTHLPRMLRTSDNKAHFLPSPLRILSYSFLASLLFPHISPNLDPHQISPQRAPALIKSVRPLAPDGPLPLTALQLRNLAVRLSYLLCLVDRSSCPNIRD